MLTNEDKLKYELLIGNKPEKVLDEFPFGIFHKDAINFLSQLSKELLNKDLDLNYFKGFGFWSRKANLLRLKNKRTDIESRVGRGIALHIAPSNISANTLYTFAFGLLSGSPSIIRVSNKNVDELKDILYLINNLFLLKEFNFLAVKYSFITYEHDSNLSSHLSSLVDSRIIWGGDETIGIFKSFKTKSHCLDLVFPNKVSSSIISTKWLVNADSNELKNKANLYSRDIGLFSQMACSSPSSLILLKDHELTYKEELLNFFQDCDFYLSKKEWLSEVHSLSNFKSSIDICMQFPNSACIFRGSNISVFSINKNHFKEINNFKAQNCCLFVFEVDSIDEFSKILPSNNQTVVCLGLNKETKRLLSIKAIYNGTNRFVNVGNALNMDIYWDGYDVISFLSKLICLN